MTGEWAYGRGNTARSHGKNHREVWVGASVFSWVVLQDTGDVGGWARANGFSLRHVSTLCRFRIQSLKPGLDVR